MPSSNQWHSSNEWVKARAYAKTVLEPICQECGKHLDGKDWTIDHIIPPGDGEPDHNISNLRSLCRSCNSSKQDKIGQRMAFKKPRWYA